jgi:hypothetical protein
MAQASAQGLALQTELSLVKEWTQVSERGKELA